MKFAPEYVTYVLNENFEDAKELLLGPLMAIEYAHLVMLTAQGIVSPGDAHALRCALDGIDSDKIRRTAYDGTYEDLFFYVERLIIAACGEDIAGRLHTARSRNDIDMTMYRMRQRELILGLIAATCELRDSLLGLAGRHTQTILAVHTHTQRAQPTTVAHYLLAMIEQLERDTARLESAYERTNRNPLGACAITGTGFPIDRQQTSELLGFCGPTGNTYGSIATVDYLLESASAASVLLTGLGRFVQDMLLWSTSEVGYLRLGDGYVQSSSIMPQKRNPVALEHARAIGSKALGQAQAITLAVHNTPFGDIVDTEDDLQPLVFAMFRDAMRTVNLVAAAIATAEFDAQKLEARAGDGWTTLTELADTLVREHQLPFRTAHAISSRLMAARLREPERPLAQLLAEASADLLGAPLAYSDEALATILSPRHFVTVRRTLGGPAPDVTSAAIDASRQLLDADRGWWTTVGTALAAAEERLAAESARL
ncbi:MAG TPA: argininosuccinate lyase [Vicinamibacterales bacterium]|jgi:argininosuccinate lyase|nr:argininosuccinate lyase [Vicinamibacterales bacterium]